MQSEKSLIDLCISSPAKIRILKTLFAWKGKNLPENQLAQLSHLSTYGARHALGDLEASGLVNKKIVGHSNVWDLNEEGFAYQYVKPVVEKILEIPSPLEFVKQQILREPLETVAKIIFFGSVVTTEFQKIGDIDVAVILKKSKSSQKTKKLLEEKMDQVAGLVGLKLGKRLESHVFTFEDWEKRKNSPLGLEVRKGKEIYPREEI